MISATVFAIGTMLVSMSTTLLVLNKKQEGCSECSQSPQQRQQ
jgi:hypothetical protein